MKFLQTLVSGSNTTLGIYSDIAVTTLILKRDYIIYNQYLKA